MGRTGLLGHRLADAVCHAVEPLADRLIKFCLPRTKHFGHGLHAALHLGLCFQNLGHAIFRIAGTIFCLRFGHRSKTG
ncbi:hypothetical protein D3C80_506330 [compost metagenome]